MANNNKLSRPSWGGLAVAKKALTCWNINVQAMRHICFGENATWRIKTKSSVFALRIYRPGRWTDQQINVEHSFMNSLGFGFAVEAPVAGKSGETLQLVPQSSFRAALFPWVSGRLFLGEPTKKHLNRLGSYLGSMHSHIIKVNHSISHQSSGKGTSHRLWDKETLLFQPLEVTRKIWPSLDLEKSILTKLIKRVKQFSRLWDKARPLKALVHADLHFGNLKWSPEELRPIDFDDCGIAPLAYDLAVPACCFYGSKTKKDVLVDFLSGYEETAPKPVSLFELRLFMSIRKIWMIGWCIERPEIFNKDMLRVRCKNYIEHLDNLS